MGDGSWAKVDWDEVATHHFVKSPIGLIPPHGYAQRDNYSMHAMEWILLQEKSGNEGLRIQHTQSDYGEKKVPYKDKKGRHHHYHLDGYFLMHAVTNMPMNLMGASITVALAVSSGIGKHSTFKEKIFNSIT